jgi:hypothetical protein
VEKKKGQNLNCDRVPTMLRRLPKKQARSKEPVRRQDDGPAERSEVEVE